MIQLTQKSLVSRVGQYIRSRPGQYHSALVVALVGLVVIFSILSPGFLSSVNLLNLSWEATPLAIVSAGQTFVVISGGADLSVGSMMGLASICAAALLAGGANAAVAILVGLVVGLIGGLINGAISIFSGVPSFVITFATGAIFLGLEYAVASLGFGGLTGVLIGDNTFTFLGRGDWLGSIPPSLVIAVLVGLIMSLILGGTAYGLRLKAVGGNAEVASQAGVATSAMRVSVFCIAGVLAALAGLLYSAGNLSVSPGVTGVNMEFQSITCVILGGTRLQGGEGGIGGTYIAVVLLTVLYSGLGTIGLSQSLLPIVQGAVLLIVIGAGALLGSRGGRARRLGAAL